MTTTGTLEPSDVVAAFSAYSLVSLCLADRAVSSLFTAVSVFTPPEGSLASAEEVAVSLAGVAVTGGSSIGITAALLSGFVARSFVASASAYR